MGLAENNYYRTLGLTGAINDNENKFFELAPSFPRILAQSAIPFILPSSGSIENNGALSGITALPTTYSGGCWMYFPANAIAAGVAAGWYWTVMSSTTAGTIYNSTYISGTNFVGTATAFATTGPGAYTQTLAAYAYGPTFTVPGGSIGPNGQLHLETSLTMAATADNRGWSSRLGGSAFAGTSSFGATTTASRVRSMVGNRNSQSSQIGTGYVAFSSSSIGAATYYITVNTAADVTLDIGLIIFTTAATNFIVLEAWQVTVEYGA